VRPAIVESALKYPFPGWNEGMNTSAPLAYLGLHGQLYFPGSNDLILDVVPVDYVASCIIAATAALLAGETSKVYQVAAGDVNPCTMARTVTPGGPVPPPQDQAGDGLG
jgi:long-chain acyl-CoA synthetase